MDEERGVGGWSLGYRRKRDVRVIMRETDQIYPR